MFTGNENILINSRYCIIHGWIFFSLSPGKHPIDFFKTGAVHHSSWGLLQKRSPWIAWVSSSGYIRVPFKMYSTLLDTNMLILIMQIYTRENSYQHSFYWNVLCNVFHWSKAMLSKIKTGLNPAWDRCNQAPVSLLHMIWTCPKLHYFWQLIFNTFSKILKRPMDRSLFLPCLVSHNQACI